MNLVGHRILDRYDVLQRLAAGGMGVVYLAEDVKFHRQVAVKTIRFDSQFEEEQVQYLRNALIKEAAIAARLNHPGIVTIFDSFELAGLACVVMEYIPGITLAQALRIGPFAREVQFKILRQIAEALDFAHSKSVVHRDIKPANIMIRTDVAGTSGQVKIADFGIAREASRGTARQTAIVGTPEYMSPEQSQGLPADARSDQFSFALVAHELLTGTKAVTSAHREREPDPAVPPAAADALRTALDENPRRRYGSCQALIADLESAIRDSDHRGRPIAVPDVPVTPLPTARRTPSRVTRVALPVLLLVIVIVGLLLPWTRLSTYYNRLRSPVRDVRADLSYVWIPDGLFLMGCVPEDSECDFDEKPRHQVTLTRGFWLSSTEVTVGAFERYTRSGAGASMPEPPTFNADWREKAQPIVNVSWNDATQFCEWAGGRLPTEAEWERAARARSEGWRYPWGNPINHDHANYGAENGEAGRSEGRDRWEFAAPVGSFAPNQWGVFDTSGNVMEWTKDWYEETYYAQTVSIDPRGPVVSPKATKVLRGGSWRHPARLARASWRIQGDPGLRLDDVGFRCVSEHAPDAR